MGREIMNCLDPGSNYTLFLEVTRLHYLSTHSAFQKQGVYPGQPHLLFALYRNDGQSQMDLARGLRMKPPTVTIMLKRLEKAGMVKRGQDKSDQRIVRVYITDYGRKICLSIYEEIQRIEEKMFSGLTAEEKETLNGLFRRVRDNLKDLIDSQG